tara:strand:- start:100 stop:1581 length:1482 start_codon:yes stop_codon:yes gene_type:complete
MFFSCGGVKNTSTSQDCRVNSKYYSVSKIIKKSTYKNRSVTSFEKTSLKQDLIKQISEKISVVSRLNEQLTEEGEIGSYVSFFNNKSIVSSVGSVNNPEFIYCKSGRRYYLYCVVPIKDFEVDLFNEASARLKIFRSKVNLAINSSNSKNRIYDNDEMSKLSDTNLYLSNTAELIAVSRYISKSDKNQIIEDVALANAEFFKLENLSNFNFDNQINKLNRFLLNNEFEKIHFELISLSKKQFSPNQRESLIIFKTEYEKKFEIEIEELDLKIKKAISNRQNNELTKKLLTEYSYTVFYKKQKEKYESYKKQIDKRSGYARNALRLGLYAGSSFNEINNSSGQINVDQLDNNLNFDNILPSYEFSLIHYFLNPKKRFGLSVNFKSFSDTFVKLSGSDDIENSINDFNSLQFGISYGPIEIKYGSVVKGSFDDLALSSLVFSIIRTNKISGNPGKSNSINLSAFGDYFSDFKNTSFYRIGVSLDYNILFNRTSKY